MTEAPLRPANDTMGIAAIAAERFLARAAEIEPDLRAFRSIDAGHLRADAAALDALPESRRGPLHGMLLAVKEVFDVCGYVCGWGTPIHDGRRPAADARAVARLRAAGALVAGITVSSEYAISRTGPTTNPFDPARTPGASSQGSAAAVGAGLVPAALGSQTIGSIIRPASYCGCIGFKPTWGAIDVGGSMPLSGPLDHVGFLAADPKVAAALMDVLMPAMAAEPVGLPTTATVLRPWYSDGAAPAVLAALDEAAGHLRAKKIAVGDGVLPDGVAAQEAGVIDTLLAHDMAMHHGGDFDAQGDKMSDRVRDYITRGRGMTAADYTAALAGRDKIAAALDDWIGDGVILMPATVDVAPLLSEGTGPREPQRLWTLGGQPAMTVPVARADGLPIGVQVIARRGADRRVLAVAALLFDNA
jgi:Asp-tRNA(Asn)/Glu-tRNA(Gln) amidotransferase A subunit family amidase